MNHSDERGGHVCVGAAAITLNQRSGKAVALLLGALTRLVGDIPVGGAPRNQPMNGRPHVFWQRGKHRIVERIIADARIGVRRAH